MSDRQQPEVLSYPGTLTRAIRTALSHPWVVRGAAALSAGHGTIFLMHRFEEARSPGQGLPIDVLRRHLAWLRSERYRLTSLASLVSDLREQRGIASKTVAFTIDDGYADFAELAAPVFAEFDCPVTVFLVTDFIDQASWLWWDRIATGLTRSRRRACAIDVDGGRATYSWRHATERAACFSRIAELLKWMPARARDEAIRRLLVELEVELPARPIPECAAMTWEQVRRLEGTTVSFGPHSRSHPILSQEDDETATAEIAGSWHHLRSMIPSALPIFAYPNGDAAAFGRREECIVATLGLQASVSTEASHVSSRLHGAGPELGLPVLPRLGFETEFARFTRLASGLSRWAALVPRRSRRLAAPAADLRRPTAAEQLRDGALRLMDAGRSVWPQAIVEAADTSTPAEALSILGTAADENWLWIAPLGGRTRALDASGGCGHATAALLNHFQQVQYQDSDPRWVAFARHRFKDELPERLQLRKGSPEALSAADGPFDCIALRLDAAMPDERARAAISGCSRALAKQGLLKLVPGPMPHVPRGSRTPRTVLQAAWRAISTHRRWMRALTESGFVTVRVYYLHPSPQDPIYIFPARSREVLAAERLRHDRLTGGAWRGLAIRLGLHPTWYRHYFLLASR